MRTKSTYLFLPLVFLSICLLGVIETKAMNTGFSTETFSDEEKAQLVKDLDITFFKTMPQKRGILCFDVNEEGMIAVYQEHSDDKEVCVYTSRGEFLYGYSIRAHGSICVEWDNENINILFIRGRTLVSVDPNGNILDIKDVPYTTENNRYSEYLQYSFRRTIGDTTYRIRNDMGWILNAFAVSCSQIVVTDPMGTDHIIYDVNTIQLIKYIVILHLIGGFVTIAIIVIVREFKKARFGKRL